MPSRSIKASNMPQVILLFVISPIASLPFILSGIFKKQHSYLVLLSLFMALCAILSPPFADLYVHSMGFKSYQNSTYNVFGEIFSKQDYVLYLLEYVFAKIGLHFEFIRGLFVFICYQVTFKLYTTLFEYVPRLSSDKQLRILLFLVFFLTVPFIWITNGLRSATSSYILIYSWLCLYNKQYFKCIVFAIIGVSTHFFGFVFIPIMLIFLFRKQKLNHWVYLMAIAVFVVVGNLVLTNSLNAISSESLSSIGVSATTKDYYLGSDAQGGVTYLSVSVNGMIAMLLERLPIILILVYSLFDKKKWKNGYDQFIFRCCLLLLALMMYSWIPFQRISWLVLPIVMFVFIKNLSQQRLLFYVRILFFASILVQYAYMYGYRYVLINTPFYLLLLPLPFSMFHTFPLGFDLTK